MVRVRLSQGGGGERPYSGCEDGSSTTQDGQPEPEGCNDEDEGLGNAVVVDGDQGPWIVVHGRTYPFAPIRL